MVRDYPYENVFLLSLDLKMHKKYWTICLLLTNSKFLSALYNTAAPISGLTFPQTNVMKKVLTEGFNFPILIWTLEILNFYFIK